MSFKTITSADNSIIKQTVALNQKKYRTAQKRFIVEGLRSVREALFSDFDIVQVFLTQDFFDKNADVVKTIEKYDCIIVSNKIFAKLSDTQNPQGILCVVEMPDRKTSPKRGRFIYLDDVSDPGNVGTIIRTADAFGFDGMLLSPNSADIFNGKIVRSSMGSIFHIDLYTDFTLEKLKLMKQNGHAIISTALTDNAKSIYSIDFPENVIFVIGNEANGVSQGVLSLSDETCIIPMQGSSESLNASVAATVIMSESSRRLYAK